MKANFQENPKSIASALEKVTISTKHTGSGNIEATVKGNSCCYGYLQL